MCHEKLGNTYKLCVFNKKLWKLITMLRKCLVIAKHPSTQQRWQMWYAAVYARLTHNFNAQLHSLCVELNGILHFSFFIFIKSLLQQESSSLKVNLILTGNILWLVKTFKWIFLQSYVNINKYTINTFKVTDAVKVTFYKWKLLHIS